MIPAGSFGSRDFRLEIPFGLSGLFVFNLTLLIFPAMWFFCPKKPGVSDGSNLCILRENIYQKSQEQGSKLLQQT
jgi:hypothetical protein